MLPFAYIHMKTFQKRLLLALAPACIILIAYSCAPTPKQLHPPPPPIGKITLKIGYAVQVGAFSKLENAVHLAHKLQKQNLLAFYFKDASGLYKVRFGNFSSRAKAVAKARALRRRGIITNFYIVKPRPLARILSTKEGRSRLRIRLVKTAHSFLGLPYRWGGNSPGMGFDCSGLTVAVYYLNGIALPRSSYLQWTAGRSVTIHNIKKGDLVFFATSRGHRVSHVGIYIGKRQFIHAPGKGKTIRIDSLHNSYFRKHFVGARRYI